MADIYNNSSKFYRGTGGPEGRSNKFETIPVLNDWDLRKDDHKVDSLTFSSFEYFKPGEHVKLKVGGKLKFGGQIYKPSSKNWGLYSYEALGYAQRLLTQISLVTKAKQRASDIVKYLFKKKLIDTSILTPKIKATKYKYPKMVFKKKTALEIIGTLIWLEYELTGDIIDFNVDANGTLTFRSQPSKVKGVEICEAVSKDFSVDYSNVVTGYTVYDEKNEKITSWKNELKSKIWGNVFVVESMYPETSSDSSSFGGDVKSVVSKVNKNLKNTSYASCDCRCISGKIFEQLKSNQVPCKWVRYPSSYASSGYHDSVLVKDGSSWVDFDYTGMHKLYNAISARSKSATWIIKQYP